MTPDEAREKANQTLAVLYANVTTWDEAILDQALLAIAGGGRPFSANDLWSVVPEMGRGTAGLYFGALARRSSPRILRKVADEPSINEKAHGKPVNLYLLTADGRRFLEQRREARNQPTEAAA